MTVTLPGWVVILAEQMIIILGLLVVIFYVRSRKLKKILIAKSSVTVNEGADSTNKTPEQQTQPGKQETSVLHEQLEMARQRVKNLEQFRDMFFDLKNKVSGLLDSQDKMYGHMKDAGLPLQEQKALLEAYGKLQKEKEQLEEHLSQVDAELELLLSDKHKSAPGTKQDTDAQIIQQQQSDIARLIQEVADLTVEQSSPDKIQSTISELTQRSNELSIAVEILQDENQFLSDQIQALLQQQNDKDRQAQRKTDTLAKQLAALQTEYDSLNEKHLRMESEYLKLQQ